MSDFQWRIYVEMVLLMLRRLSQEIRDGRGSRKRLGDVVQAVGQSYLPRKTLHADHFLGTSR